MIGKVEAAITQRLAEEGLHFRVQGRVKAAYSIYKKMRADHRSLKQIDDIYALRVITESVDACYRGLGVVRQAIVSNMQLVGVEESDFPAGLTL